MWGWVEGGCTRRAAATPLIPPPPCLVGCRPPPSPPSRLPTCLPDSVSRSAPPPPLPPFHWIPAPRPRRSTLSLPLPCHPSLPVTPRPPPGRASGPATAQVPGPRHGPRAARRGRQAAGPVAAPPAVALRARRTRRRPRPFPLAVSAAARTGVGAHGETRCAAGRAFGRRSRTAPVGGRSLRLCSCHGLLPVLKHDNMSHAAETQNRPEGSGRGRLAPDKHPSDESHKVPGVHTRESCCSGDRDVCLIIPGCLDAPDERLDKHDYKVSTTVFSL